MNSKGQFYIIASVLVMLSLTALSLFTIFVEFGPQTLPAQSNDFDNLHNAVTQRNAWLPNYWYDWTCKNRTVITLSSIPVNPMEFNPGISPCSNYVKVYKRSGSTRTAITSYMTPTGCNVTFNATTIGVYEIYWNCPAFIGAFPPLSGTEITPSMYIEAIPGEGICSHFSSILPKKNIAFSCSAVNNTNTYNYSVGFTATDFTYIGNLS